MTLTHDLPDHLGMALSDPAQCKKRPRRAGSGQALEEVMDTGLHTARETVPAGTGHPSLESEEVEVLLDINCEMVLHQSNPGLMIHRRLNRYLQSSLAETAEQEERHPRVTRSAGTPGTYTGKRTRGG